MRQHSVCSWRAKALVSTLVVVNLAQAQAPTQPAPAPTNHAVMVTVSVGGTVRAQRTLPLFADRPNEAVLDVLASQDFRVSLAHKPSADADQTAVRAEMVLRKDGGTRTISVTTEMSFRDVKSAPLAVPVDLRSGDDEDEPITIELQLAA